MKNIIQFRRGFINLEQPKTPQVNYEAAMSVASELMQFGYILDQSAIAHLSTASIEKVSKFHKEIISWLKKMTGSNRNYRPFWKGFPEEVMSKSESALWNHQIMHYLSNGSYEHSEWTKERKSAFENSKYTIISVGDEDRFLQIFTDLVSVNSSLTPDDLTDVKFFVSNGFELRFPSSIPFKENLCTLAAMGLNVPVKSVTDVLRIAVHLSGGDISLPPVPPARVRTNRWSSSKSENPLRKAFLFKKFSRKERRYLLGLLEQTNCDVREFVLRDSRWIRLGEILHPGEYRERFPKAFQMFDDIRNRKVLSWYGEVNRAFSQGHTSEEKFGNGIRKLSERPGEFLRRLDWILRTTGESKKREVFQVLETVAPRVSNKVLYEAFSHFENRLKPTVGRSVMIKGARKRTPLPELKAIKAKDVKSVQESIRKSLSIKFSQLEPLGSVWIDEELKKIPLPSNMRSMNSSLKPTIRGQRVPIGNQDAKVIRAFVHWFDERGDRDIDLTATYIGESGIDHVGWNGKKNDAIGCYSGDIRHRQGACAEYIDINVKRSLDLGYKWVIIDARNYNGGSLAEITDCVFGYMERSQPKANQIFVPSTLANTVRLQSSSSTTIVAVIDLETLEYIFLDIDQGGFPVASANFQNMQKAIAPYVELPKFSVYDLLSIHANSRGSLAKDEKSADLSLKFTDFSESYVEILKWMGV